MDFYYMLKFYFLFTRVFYFYSIISNNAEYYESNKTDRRIT